ncbi:3-O-acetylpapaveroxine carboxylesterase CXE2-like [Phoenix dactylifera]|uniref:3-O-acetylpapaveroxine carboxylesterase CXE2-like n=1 Tax=Phoenix dactylifera TaxID=42345 RepID=A0A8B7BR18_PHODC|nr:3-O-acetylpapaveroxine carboxylesterase CXE2-like [Phoenix dactylifera]
MDPYEYLKISRNPDGSITRHASIPFSPANPDATPVLSKDVPLNPAHKTWLRIFLPTQSSPSPEKQLPVVFYFHGGGFILLSAGTTLFHDFCVKLSAELPAVVLSVEYRLAPEHRLPAAYDDAVDALLWACAQALGPASAVGARADFSRCFLMGSSAGANIAYHAGLRAMAMDLNPLKIQGLILYQPFFGGKDRTESETRMAEDPVLALPVNDLMWELSLPEGADRDHEYCNPVVGKTGREGATAVAGLPRCLVKGHTGDPLLDRQKLFLRMLERGGVEVVAWIEEGGCHGIDVHDAKQAEKLLSDIRGFASLAAGAGAAAAAGAGEG